MIFLTQDSRSMSDLLESWMAILLYVRPPMVMSPRFMNVCTWLSTEFRRLLGFLQVVTQCLKIPYTVSPGVLRHFIA